METKYNKTISSESFVKILAEEGKHWFTIEGIRLSDKSEEACVSY